jgi:hypothetical protein
MPNSIYYLTGMGGRLNIGLGEGLLSRGFEVTGRELVGEFRMLDFQQQVDVITDDLIKRFWDENACVLANSFGAYLFLHAQTQIEPYIGRVILLSPIIGEFGNDEARKAYIPPRSGRLMELARANKFPILKRCEIHVGELDWQSNPSKVCELGEMLGIKVQIVSNAGHKLPKDYVGRLLDGLRGV